MVLWYEYVLLYCDMSMFFGIVVEVCSVVLWYEYVLLYCGMSMFCGTVV